MTNSRRYYYRAKPLVSMMMTDHGLNHGMAWATWWHYTDKSEVGITAIMNSKVGRAARRPDL